MLAHDNSIRDPRELKQIEEAIIGPNGRIHVRFVDHAARDASKEAQQRDRIEKGSDEVARPFFKRVPYIEKRFEGQKDFISKPATEQDKREHRQAWEEYQKIAGRPPRHAIQLLPGNDVVTLAIFNELNILHIEDFLEFSEQHPDTLDIFEELKPLLDAAKRWRTFMKPRLKLVNGEMKDGND